MQRLVQGFLGEQYRVSCAKSYDCSPLAYELGPNFLMLMSREGYCLLEIVVENYGMM